ncbi:XdhC/CoxI family protein [Paenibacillus thiaminolyticus]|uniref:XdhC family protein n=1 Tax=Paenibacillus thiaminolyticus TaxID=49283 RepID=UPI003D28FB82
MATIYTILDKLRRDEQRSVLATIIRVEGSAYRKEGTSMLIQEDGTQIGMLSGGCLEQDLAVHAEEALATGQSLTVMYDMSAEDDLSWGQGAGCNGRIHVLLEPVHPWMRDQLLRLRLCLEQGMSVIVMRKLGKDNGTERICFLASTGEMFGHHRSECGLSQGDMKALRRLEWERSGRMAYISAAGAYYVQRYNPKPRLIVLGAGADAKPLVRTAAQSGFAVTLWDWRESLCSKEQFPQADECIVGPPALLGSDVHFRTSDAVVLMTHHFQHDRVLLEAMLQMDIFYLGILGPRRRTSRLLGGTNIPEYVHSPIGLPIGADGPEEIAISIMAEIISKLRLRHKKESECRS